MLADDRSILQLAGDLGYDPAGREVEAGSQSSGGRQGKAWRWKGKTTAYDN